MLSKTLNNIFNNFEPRIKRINHSVKSGDTFNKFLEDRISLNNEDKEEIKNELKNYKFNKLNIGTEITIKIDQLNNELIEFKYPNR